jgi:serine/threonine-protein kinase
MHASTAHGQAAPPRIAAAIMSGVLHGLHAAHEARDEKGEPLEIVHRDVSPQNVLIGIDGIPRLIDFGVATAVGRLQSTSSGTLKGKMAYMAPERVRGDSADRRSDIYATAVLLWEMLTGRRLFRGDDETQILAQVLKGWHEPPSAHSPGLSPLFDPVVMRGLALDPTERFTTAAEMARALEACSGLASPSEVGDWVQAMAGEELTRRAEAISRVESQSGTMPAATVETLSGADVQTSISDVRSSPSRISARLRVAALAASPAMRAALGVTIPTGPALFVGAAAIVAGIVLATVLALRGRPDAAAPSTVPSVSVSAVTTPEETGAAATPEPTEETPPSASSVVAPSRAAPRALVPGGPATPPLSRPRPNCDPPYVYDVDGVKHYKRECN